MIKEYFSLSSNERNGLFVLVMLALAAVAYIHCSRLNYQPEVVDLSTLQDSVEQYYASRPPIEKPKESYYPKKKETSYNTYSNKAVETKPKKQLEIIELNNANTDELLKISGVGEYYAKKIIEEREKLGGFSNKEQLLNIYGMTTENLARIEKQITIDTSLVQKKERIPINSADTLLLAEIYGLNSYAANRIYKYRERLGGFYSLEQLKEVYGIDEKLYLQISERIILDTIELRLIDINNAPFKEVMKHPYIDGYDNTKAIFRYLEYGEIKTWKEFGKIPDLNIENLEGLKHYVKFEPMRPKPNTSDSILKETREYSK